MTHSAIAVFTAKSLSTILEEGGSSSWKLDRNNARICEYLVCTRNAHADWVQGPEEHSSAFLVGKVSDIVPAPDSEGRWLISISEYALVEMPDVWQGWRNPVKYTTLEDLGFDLAALSFQLMPPPSAKQATLGEYKSNADSAFARAKQIVAGALGVPANAIEITVRG